MSGDIPGGLIEGSFPSHGFIGSVADNVTLKRIVPHWHSASISLRWSMSVFVLGLIIKVVREV